MSIKGIWAAAAVGATALAGTPAGAAVLVLDYQTTSTFIQASAPVKSLVLNFTLTYDPVVAYSNVAVSNYKSSSAAAQFHNGAVVFSNMPNAGGGNILTIGGGLYGSQYLEGTNDFFVTIVVDAAGNPIGSPLDTVEYTMKGFRASYNAPRPQVSVTAAGAVPEPATWAMLVGGFGMVGAAARRRKLRTAWN